MSKAVILNAGSGAWAFEAIAETLSRALEIPVSETPANFNYLLSWGSETPPSGRCFIPFESIEIATDKRKTAEAFAASQVPSPETHLIASRVELNDFLADRGERRWLLKWPVGCGASGHRFIEASDEIDAGNEIDADWPLPFVVQEFIAMEKPEVFRLYAVAGETFGWNARRFPGDSPSPFVAHAQGARYEAENEAPPEAVLVAKAALQATGLLDSFGCADLLRAKDGRWLALEVNTDGRWMHVDRDISLPGLATEIERRLASAFKSWVQS